MRDIEQVPAQLNLARVLLEIRKSNGTIRSSLAHSLQLSFATVSNLIKVLEENGFISSDQLSESSGGRRATEIKFNPTARYSVAMQIEHDLRVRLSLLDLLNRVVDETVIDPNSISSVDELISYIGSVYRKQLKLNKISESRIIGAGVAIPGVFNSTTGMVQATTSPALSNLNIKDRLKRALSCAVQVHNDADMAALAFSIKHQQDIKNMILIYFTVGIGLGIVIDGGVYNGESGLAGELGHTHWGWSSSDGLPADNSELKSILSVRNFITEFHQKEFDDKELNENWLELMNDIKDAYNDGDEQAFSLLQRTGRVFGQVVGTLADLFDPGVIAIAGRVDPILPVWLPFIREQVRLSSFCARNRDLMITEAPDISSLILEGCGEVAFNEWIRTSGIIDGSST